MVKGENLVNILGNHQFFVKIKGMRMSPNFVKINFTAIKAVDAIWAIKQWSQHTNLGLRRASTTT